MLTSRRENRVNGIGDITEAFNAKNLVVTISTDLNHFKQCASAGSNDWKVLLRCRTTVSYRVPDAFGPLNTLSYDHI